MNTTRRNALIIGGTKGIGRALAGRLARDGADVTIVGRDRDAGTAAAEHVGARFLQADISLQHEVRRVASVFAAEHEQLHDLFHTADVIPRERRETAEGFEVSFATNYLSRFLCNALLLPRLRAGAEAGGARIVHVAAASGSGRLDLAKVPPPPGVGAFRAHGIGQGANDLYGVELAHRLAGSGIAVHVLNPGGVDTSIRSEVETTLLGRVMLPLFSLLMRIRTAEESADAILEAVRTHRDAVLIDAKGRPLSPGPRLRDAARRERLWQLTEQAVGLTAPDGDRLLHRPDGTGRG